MWLDVGVFSAEQLTGSIPSQIFDDVDIFAAAVVATSGVAFGVFVCEYGAGGFHDGGAGVVFGGDEFESVDLSQSFAGDGGPQLRVGVLDRGGSGGGGRRGHLY